MIPLINFVSDCPVKIEGDQIPTMFMRHIEPAPATISPGEVTIRMVPMIDDVPDSFAEGMREIQEGRAIDFDSAFRAPPPVE